VVDGGVECATLRRALGAAAWFVLEEFALRADAVDFGRYGIPAFYASQTAEVDALCETRLSQFETVAVFERTNGTDRLRQGMPSVGP
jgi:hypothetical protein